MFTGWSVLHLPKSEVSGLFEIYMFIFCDPCISCQIQVLVVFVRQCFYREYKLICQLVVVFLWVGVSEKSCFSLQHFSPVQAFIRRCSSLVLNPRQGWWFVTWIHLDWELRQWGHYSSKFCGLWIEIESLWCHRLRSLNPVALFRPVIAGLFPVDLFHYENREILQGVAFRVEMSSHWFLQTSMSNIQSMAIHP